MTVITEGRIKATIRFHPETGFYVLATRDDQCLPGIPGKHYASEKAAITGARRMIKKAR